jgi:nitrate reductase gamma subunit
MIWYQYLALVALFICIANLLFHAIRFFRLGPPKDYSRQSGNTGSSIIYSFTGAMSPAKKESAYLHLPTYTAGLFYHSGTFLSIGIFFILLFGADLSGWIKWLLVAILAVSAISGTGILIKRITLKKIRSLSNPDDYISNVLVTLFQIMTLIVLISEIFLPIYFLAASFLLLYIPLGKLKHALYFFAARYQLGLFYGWRGVWPVRKP